MRSVKELWNDLFDSSLEKYQNEDESIRNLNMILHILKLEYRKITEYVLELKQRNLAQTTEISEYKQKQCACKNNRTPLKSLSENCNEKTPKKRPSHQNINTSFDVSDNEDVFNHQITELDVNLSKENDNSLFIDDSVDDFNITTSPTLNKSKNKRISRIKNKNEENKNVNVKDIVLNTPTPKINRSKKFKQPKLTISALSTLSKTKNCTVTRSKSVDSDETLFIPGAVNKKMLERTPPKTLENEYKKIRLELDDSFNIIPEKEKDSPDFVYKREALRKKSERMQLQGWNCPDCERYYNTYKNKLSDEELKKKLNACSRHRDKFNPNILTPQGFWNPDFSPTQDSIAFQIQ